MMSWRDQTSLQVTYYVTNQVYRKQTNTMELLYKRIKRKETK